MRLRKLPPRAKGPADSAVQIWWQTKSNGQNPSERVSARGHDVAASHSNAVERTQCSTDEDGGGGGGLLDIGEKCAINPASLSWQLLLSNTGRKRNRSPRPCVESKKSDMPSVHLGSNTI